MVLSAIANPDIRKLNPYCFLIYSDSILESINILDLLTGDNPFLQVIGVSYEPIDQPVYFFKEKRNGKYICVKVLGKYENWELPPNISELVNFIDRPDFVIVDGEKNKEIFVGETTGTANVGNSQWQREGRKISAALKQIPTVYQTYYSGTDRSKFSREEIDKGEVKGQVRQPTSLQVINHFIYSLRYRVPSFVIYYPNLEYDSLIGFDRSKTKGEILLRDYVATCLLNSIDENYKTDKKKIEHHIFEHMLNFINEMVPHRNATIKRVDKDFPVQPANEILKSKGEAFVNYLVDYINQDVQSSEKFHLINWNFNSFYEWNHRYKQTRLLKFLLNNKLSFLSYLPNATKAGFTLETQSLILLLDKAYPKDKGKFSPKLNNELPTLIIPTLMFQKKDDRYIHKVDPGTGEIVAFAELFSKDLQGNKNMNVLIYVYIQGPDEFSTNTKLFKAIKHYADCLIINERLYEL
jgi:hypothetical protein